VSSALFEALARLGIAEVDGPDGWRRLVVVRNFSDVPVRYSEAPLGFKFIVNDERGQPRWFGRCGWDAPAAMRAECALLDALARDAMTSRHVPEARFTHLEDTTVQVSRHLGDVAYDRRLRNRTSDQWLRDTAEILTLSEDMLVHLHRSAPSIFCEDPDGYRRDQLGRDLDLLERRGLGTTLVHKLRTVLLSGLDDLPVALQHGDLWPANVLRAEDRWWLIDFSECGLMWLPGYDLYLFLVNGPAGFDTSWIAPSPAAFRQRWNVTRMKAVQQFAARHGFSAQTMGMLLLHFLVRLTAYRMRPGVSPRLSAHWQSELVRIGPLLDHGEGLEVLLRPSR